MYPCSVGLYALVTEGQHTIFFCNLQAVEFEEETEFKFFWLFPNEAVQLRMERALFAMGPNVMLAGGSTFLGVSVLAFSASPVFRMFFWLVLVLVVAAVLHALMFVPVLLTFFPPAPSQRGVENNDGSPLMCTAWPGRTIRSVLIPASSSSVTM